VTYRRWFPHVTEADVSGAWEPAREAGLDGLVVTLGDPVLTGYDGSEAAAAPFAAAMAAADGAGRLGRLDEEDPHPCSLPRRCARVPEVKSHPPSPRRKVTLALWRGPREGTMHSKLVLDVERALGWLDRQSEACGHRVTLTHLVGKAVARALVAVPELNRSLRGGRFVPHGSVALSFLVSTDDGDDVGWVKLEALEDKTVAEVAAELGREAARLREGAARPTRSPWVRLLPVWLLRPLLLLAGWLTAGRGLSLKAFGLDRHPFGAGVITNGGTFGIDEVWVARTPLARVAFNLVVCRVRERPVVVDGEVTARRCVTLCLNSDHRFVDGVHLGRALQVIREGVEDPEGS